MHYYTGCKLQKADDKKHHPNLHKLEHMVFISIWADPVLENTLYVALSCRSFEILVVERLDRPRGVRSTLPPVSITSRAHRFLRWQAAVIREGLCDSAELLLLLQPVPPPLPPSLHCVS